MTVTINGTTGLATDSTSAVVEAVSLNHPSSSTAAITMDASNNVTLAGDLSVDTNTLYVDSTNNRVGVGTASPGELLDVSGNIRALGANSRVMFGPDGFEASIKYATDASLQIASRTGEPITFTNGTDGTEAMRILSNGYIYYATTSTVGNSSSSGMEFRPSSLRIGSNFATDNIVCVTDTTGSKYFFTCYQAGTFVGSITGNGSNLSFNTSSDYRLKENVVDLTNASDRIKQIPVRRFNFISKPDRTVDGFLAHEVQSVVPEAVTGTQDGMRDEEYEVTPAVYDDEGNLVSEAVMGTRSVPDYQGIDQSKLVPLLTAALQEALSEIADLKTRVAALETP
jgi:hypothetical protein